MDAIRFGLGIRALRRRRGWSQAELARRVGLSRSVVSRMERGRADRVALYTVQRVAAALDARVDVRLLWRGEGLDRLLDRRHATLVNTTLELLGGAGWAAASEVSFNVFGERGSIDILAFHAGTGSLLVVEVKSVVPDIQAMLVALDRKGRVARSVAADRGWPAASVTRILVLPDDRTSRRRVESLAATFRSALPARTVEVRRWIKSPVGTGHGVLFLSDERQEGGRQQRSASRRVD